MNGFQLWPVGVCTFAALNALAQETPRTAAVAMFHFREPSPQKYRIDTGRFPARITNTRLDWVQAWPESGSRFPVEFGSRVGLQLKPGSDLRELLAASPLAVSRVVATNLFILQA